MPSLACCVCSCYGGQCSLHTALVFWTVCKDKDSLLCLKARQLQKCQRKTTLLVTKWYFSAISWKLKVSLIQMQIRIAPPSKTKLFWSEASFQPEIDWRGSNHWQWKRKIYSDLRHLGFRKFRMITSKVVQICPKEAFDQHDDRNKVSWAEGEYLNVFLNPLLLQC